jgi:uncharacterized damage-inducible protein DinB
MSPSEPAISFRELFAYTDYLANRWLTYFTRHEAALEIDVGGQTGTLRNLVKHILQVELFFASRLLEQEPPEDQTEVPTLAELLRTHQDAHGKFTRYIKAGGDEKLCDTQMLGTRRVSNRKILAQAALHSVHHWAQVAMEVRQAGFPAEKPQDFIITDVME